MTYEERQLIKKIKEEIELSLYSRIIEHIMRKMNKFEDLNARDRLEVTVLISKMRKLNNRYIA
jgi:hypothetical protein